MPASRTSPTTRGRRCCPPTPSLMKQFAAEDIWTDVSMREYDVLYTLSKCPEPLRLSELNRHVLLSQPALSRLVDRLAERGLVRARRPTPPTGAASGCRSPPPAGARSARSAAGTPAAWPAP